MNGFMDDIKLSKKSERLLYAWVFLPVFTLIFAGIFALLIALARTPLILNLLPGKDYFYIALVGHVILAVVIWFLTFKGALWVLTTTGFLKRDPFSLLLGWVSFWLTAAGTILIILPPITGSGVPVIVNYIPVIEHPLFYIGLILAGIGVLLTIINTLLTILDAKKANDKLPVPTFAMGLTGIVVIIAFICIGMSYYFQAQKAFIDFERLFWGGGHVLQFANAMAMATAWMLLTKFTINKYPVNNGLASTLYLLYLLFALPAPIIYLLFDIASQRHKDAFTELMRWGMGSSGAFVILVLVAIFFKRERGAKLPWSDPGFSSLIMSIAIFTIGGLTAFTISGVNVKIPAHYHGAVGGVTIAFMGLGYKMLPLLKREIYYKRLGTIQPYLYGMGLLLFMLGLFLAGSHGMQRKVYGSDQILDNLGKIIGMGVMGVGGLVAIAGGATFVWNMLVSLIKRDKGASEPVGDVLGLEKAR
ncbi:MAG: cbb3-type cytochrome c oxidase subunit I [Nitrospirota bacterium]